MTVATFDVDFGRDAQVTQRRPAYATQRDQLVVQRRLQHERGIRVYTVRRNDASEGDAWRLLQLWELTQGVLEMDATDPETGNPVVVTFVDMPRVAMLGPNLARIEFALEESL